MVEQKTRYQLKQRKMKNTDVPKGTLLYKTKERQQTAAIQDYVIVLYYHITGKKKKRKTNKPQVRLNLV